MPQSVIQAPGCHLCNFLWLSSSADARARFSTKNADWSDLPKLSGFLRFAIL